MTNRVAIGPERRLTIRLTGRRPAFGWTVEAAAGQRLR